MDHRFRTSLLGKQILQVTDGPKDVVLEDTTTITITIWRDADRYEAESLLRGEYTR